MTDQEFDAIMSRSLLPLSQATLAELRQARVFMERFLERLDRSTPTAAEPALTFNPEQRP